MIKPRSGFVLAAGLLTACLGPVPRVAPVRPDLPVRSVTVSRDPSLPASGEGQKPFSSTEGLSLVDDGSLMDLAAAVRQSVDYYRSLPPDTTFQVGPERFTAARMASALESFLEATDAPPEEFRRRTRDLFKAFRSPETVTYSAYYEHSLDASLNREGEYQFPLYGTPLDLREEGGTVYRLGEDGSRLPYFTREEIDSKGVLEEKGLEIAWARDPLDVLFLQIQGSGWLNLPGDSQPRRIRFAAHNGQPYKSIGAAMSKKGLLQGEGNAREKMKRYMREHPEERQDLLNINPRYVFFKLDYGPEARSAIGSLQKPLTPRRSVAADKTVFPPGALAWMETDNPSHRRFVLIQDEGGAIKGPGRIDYFVGAGESAEKEAVNFWTTGSFFVFVPR